MKKKSILVLLKWILFDIKEWFRINKSIKRFNKKKFTILMRKDGVVPSPMRVKFEFYESNDVNTKAGISHDTQNTVN